MKLIKMSSMLLWAMILPAELLASSLADTIDQIKGSIVGIGTYQITRSPQSVFRGTGFVVGDGHYVITNAHVLPETMDKARNETLSVMVAFGKGGRGYPAELVEADERHDLALLRIKKKLPAMTLGDSERVRAGENYAFSGFPIGAVLGLFPVTHQGLVSVISPIAIPPPTSRRLTPKLIRQLRDPFPVFQLDATAYPGNSGSPLYAPDTGRVVGVINKVFVKDVKESPLEKPSGITYAIPISYAKILMKKHGVSVD